MLEGQAEQQKTWGHIALEGTGNKMHQQFYGPCLGWMEMQMGSAALEGG